MNHFSTNFQKISFVLIMLFLSACQGIPPHQAYEGSVRADNEIAIFDIPSPYNLLAIDNVKFKQLALRDGSIIKLLPGSHQFIVEYQDFWDLGGGEHEKVTSKPMAITFTAQAGAQYKIILTQFKNLEKAQDFAENPSVNIINTKDKQPISAEIKYNLYGKGLFTTLFSGSKSAPESYESTNKPGKNEALDMLKAWWEEADEDQQDDFRQWLKNH
jgi:uncharacterized protein YccT (UPF0319 family)